MTKLMMFPEGGNEGDSWFAQCARTCVEQCRAPHAPLASCAAQAADEDASHGEALAGSLRDQELRFRIAMLFLTGCCVMMACLVGILAREKNRYIRRRITNMGTFSDYLKYRFAHWFAWTPGSAGIVLCAVSLTLLVISSLALSLTGRPMSSSLWASWVWISDPDGGNSAEDPLGCFIGLCVSICGMLIFALLMSIVSDSIQDQLLALRHGKYPVIEGDHCVILGNSPVLFSLLEELCFAAESRGGALIAILSSTPKPDLEQAILRSGINLRNSELVVRCGDTRRKQDLEQVAVETARTAVILSNHNMGREEADCHTLHTLLILGRMRWPREGSTIVQSALVRNQHLFGRLTSGHTEVLTIEDSVGQFMVQCSHQEGIADCFNMMVGFEGDEFYIHEIEGIVGWQFVDLLLAVPNCVPVGLTYKSTGNTVLLPPMDRVIQPGDRVVLLAEDVSTLPRTVSCTRLEAQAHTGKTAWAKVAAEELHQETIVILGWNETMGAILIEIDQLVAPDSRVVIFSPVTAEERERILKAAQQRRMYHYVNITVEHMEGHLGARYRLEELPIADASRIFILADSHSGCSDTADMQTIASILQVQDIRWRDRITTPVVIVPQILDRACEDTLLHAGVKDIVNSNSMAARIVASITESPELSSVFGEILSETGAHFRLRTLSEYRVAMALECPAEASFLGTEEITSINFQDVMRCAAACGEVALGWSSRGAHGVADSSWEINPKEKFAKRPWDEATSRVLSLAPKVGGAQSPLRRQTTGTSPMQAFMSVTKQDKSEPWAVTKAVVKMKTSLLQRQAKRRLSLTKELILNGHEEQKIESFALTPSAANGGAAPAATDELAPMAKEAKPPTAAPAATS